MEEKETPKSTLEFIQLIKCIIEYYGTTKSDKKEEIKKDDNSFSSELSEAEKLLGSIGDFDLSSMTIEVPEEIDTAIKTTFLSQLKDFEDESRVLNK